MGLEKYLPRFLRGGDVRPRPVGLVRREPRVEVARPAARSAARSGGFAAAAGGNLYGNWTGAGLPIDVYLRRQLQRLVARSRELAINNPYARKYLADARKGVIGPSGIAFRNRAMTKSGRKLDTKVNAAIEAAWLVQRRLGNFTADGRHTGKSAERLVVTLVERDGECFVRFVRGGPGRYRFGVQVIPAECVDYSLCKELPGGNYIYMGIEMEPVYLRPVAYWVRTKNPHGEIGRANERHVRVPAADMLHIFYGHDVQIRGYPSYVAGMLAMNMLGGAVEAELVAARAASSKMGFFKRKSDADPYARPPGEFMGDPAGLDGENGEVGDLDLSGDDGGRPITLVSEATPGTFEELPEGYELETFDPQHPNAAFGEFVALNLRGFASATGAISFTSVANDLRGVSYSGLRHEVEGERDAWREKQGEIIDQFADPLFRAWLLWCAQTGQIAGVDLDTYERVCAPVWRGRGFKSIDAVKDATAAALRMKLRTLSRFDIASDDGTDLEDVFAETLAARELAKMYGIDLDKEDAVLLGAGSAPPPPPAEKADDKEGGKGVEGEDE